jgi:hypothetical protein
MLIAPGAEFYFEIDTSGTGLQNFDEGTYAKQFYHNGAIDSSVTLTVTNPSTGQYVGHGTIPALYIDGDICWVRISGEIDSLEIAVVPEYITVATGGGGGGGATAAQVWAYLAAQATIPGSLGMELAAFLASPPALPVFPSTLPSNVFVQQNSFGNQIQWTATLNQITSQNWVGATTTLLVAPSYQSSPIIATEENLTITQVGNVVTIVYETQVGDTVETGSFVVWLNGVGSGWEDTIPLGLMTLQGTLQ